MMFLHSCRKGEIHTAFGMFSPMRLPRVHCLLYDVHILAKYVYYILLWDGWVDGVAMVTKVPAETEIPFQLRPPSVHSQSQSVHLTKTRNQVPHPWAAPPLQSLARTRHAGGHLPRRVAPLVFTVVLAAHYRTPTYNPPLIRSTVR